MNADVEKAVERMRENSAVGTEDYLAITKALRDVREAADAIDRLTSALRRYMDASARYNGNPHDLSNIRKYAEAKGFAEGVLADYEGATHD